ncbi:MAG: phage tail tape measure protein [Pseudomonadota bacterium]
MDGYGGETEQGMEFGDAGSASAAMREELERLRGEMGRTSREAGALAGSISGSLRNAFDRLVTGGMRASDVLRRLGADLASRTFDAAVRPIHGALTEGLTGALGTILGGATGGLTAFAQGGVLSAGKPRAFAQGGVVDAPTLFGMRSGMGLMGEAGPEAILPLKRGADGKLGVAAGAGGGGAARVTVNITTPDVAGFQRSRAQVAGQVARAVRLGQRHR